MSSLFRRVAVGLVALCSVGGAVLIGGHAASAGTCLAWIDSAYFDDSTGASGYTSTCALESPGMSTADGSDSPDGKADGGMTAVHAPAPSRTLDPLCRTRVTSTIDRNLTLGTHRPVGFPRGTTGHPTVVEVMFDPNLAGTSGGVDWRSDIAATLAQWQYVLDQAGVAVRFEFDTTPVSFPSARLGVLSGLLTGEAHYSLHIGMYTGSAGIPNAVADTSEEIQDPDGRSLFSTIEPYGSIDWAAATSAYRRLILAHEVGHALGLDDQVGDVPTSVMAAAPGPTSAASQPTCSDAWSVARAMSQDPVTGFSVFDSHL